MQGHRGLTVLVVHVEWREGVTNKVSLKRTPVGLLSCTTRLDCPVGLPGWTAWLDCPVKQPGFPSALATRARSSRSNRRTVPRARLRSSALTQALVCEFAGRNCRGLAPPGFCLEPS